MPAALIPIIGLIVGGASTGLSIYQAVHGQGGGDQPAAATADPKAQASTSDAAAAQARNKQIAATIANRLPDLQAQTSGATLPEYNASVAGTEAGAGGNKNLLNDAVNKWLGLDSGGAATPATGSGAATPNFFPTEAVPDFSKFLPGGGSDTPQGLSGGSF